MEASGKEIELSRVACLLDEVDDGKPIDPSHWLGYHPKVYNRSHNGDALVAELCEKLQGKDVANYSLELQIWWRDHQKADKERLEWEIKEKDAAARKEALAKLTDYEKGLLGIA